MYNRKDFRNANGIFILNFISLLRRFIIELYNLFIFWILRNEFFSSLNRIKISYVRTIFSYFSRQ